MAFLLAFQIAVNLENRKFTPEVDFTSRWQNQVKKGLDFDYPALNWDRLAAGDAGTAETDLVYAGRRSTLFKTAEFEYQEQIGTDQHVIKVIRSSRSAPTRYRKNDPSPIDRLQGASYPIRTSSLFVVVLGELPELRRGNKLPFQHDLLVTHRTRLPVYGGIMVVKIVEFPPLPTHRAQLAIGLRRWNDNRGAFITEATFDGLSGDEVTLVERSGESIQLPVRDLSTIDQRYVRKQNIERKRGR